MTDRARAARLWLACAVVTLWGLSVGGMAEGALPASTLADLPVTHIARRQRSNHTYPRWLSIFRRGLLHDLAALITGAAWPDSRFVQTAPTHRPARPLLPWPPVPHEKPTLERGERGCFQG